MGAGDAVKAAITKQRSFGDGQIGTGQPRGRGGCGGGAGCANSSLRGRRPHVPDATRSLSRLLKQQSPQASPERVGTRVPRPGQHPQLGRLCGGSCEWAHSSGQCIYYPQAGVVVRSPPTNAGERRDVGLSLGQEGPLQKGMAAHSSVLAWRIPGTGEPGGLRSTGSQSQTQLSTQA